MNGKKAQAADRDETRPAPARLVAAADRAAAINLSLGDVMGRAGLTAGERSTVYRWLAGTADPTLSRFDALMTKVEAQVAAEEDRLRGALRRGAAA